MACSGYHSPQFSEDPAWLPAWLLPYKQDDNGFHTENEENGSLVVGKKCQSVEVSICKGGKTQLATSGSPRYDSCNLFLSGVDDLQAGSISCLNAMHFSLHLSSVSISEVLSDQHNGIPQPLKHEIKKSLAQEIVSENPGINCGLAIQKLCQEPSRRLAILPEMPNPNVSYETNTDQPIEISQNHEQICHEKLVGGNQESTTVDDLVELSITASEAVVILEMVSNSPQSESFSDAALLEIALRVKQARSECIFETEYVKSTVNPDDVDQLSDLDEDSMENAFEDDGNVSGLRNALMKKSLKLFTMESSFISESMDVINQHISQSNQSVRLEIVSSSNTVLQASSLGLHTVKELNCEAPLSPDHLRSLSLADPLCSVVPCTISCVVSVAHDSELSIDGVEKSNYPSIVLCSNYLDGNASLQGNNMMPKVFLENSEFILSETRVKYPSVPNKKQIDSLRPYSLVMDNQDIEGRSSSLCKQLPLHGMCGMTVHELFEKNLECSSDKNDNEWPRKCFDADNLHNELIPEENKNGVESLALWGTENDDSQTPVYEHKDACSPPIVNYMKHCYQPFKVNLSGENLERMKRPSTSDFWKCRSNDSTKKTSCWEEATKISYTLGKSNLQLFPADEKPRKKRVRFQETSYNKNLHSCSRSTLLYNSESGLEHKYNCFSNGAVGINGMILQGLDFLLTGFSNHKVKELEKIIRKHGGYVLPNIPSNFPYLRGNFIRSDCRKLPVVLSPKKVHTTKFLYGCAVNTFMLNDHWLFDTIQSGATLPPRKYMIRPITGTKGNMLIGESFCLSNSMPIFHKVGMMLHGKAKFCAKFMKIVKHGGGQVFKSLQGLLLSLKNGTNTVGMILVKNEGCVSRHLKQCALENDIPTVPASWIISSLLSGKLLPFKREHYASLHRIKMPSFPRVQVDESLSLEI